MLDLTARPDILFLMLWITDLSFSLDSWLLLAKSLWVILNYLNWLTHLLKFSVRNTWLPCCALFKIPFSPLLWSYIQWNSWVRVCSWWFEFLCLTVQYGMMSAFTARTKTETRSLADTGCSCASAFCTLLTHGPRLPRRCCHSKFAFSRIFLFRWNYTAHRLLLCLTSFAQPNVFKTHPFYLFIVTE